MDMKVYIAKYDDGSYPEDNMTIGIFTSDESAERAIDDEIKFHYASNFNKRLGNRFYYFIEEHEVYA